jgi:ATP-dependent HslUV protease ATP-binding subunit HslU
MTQDTMGLTPKQIVEELDRFIIGQNDAKKAVAIALRNRYRRKLVDEKLRDEIVPKNILMIGPTGVGKTEIARRLAKLSNSPFIKVEATKFTEVGYVGRDVESIIRDLVHSAVSAAKIAAKLEVAEPAKLRAIESVLDILVGKTASLETRDKFREKLHKSELDDREIEIDLVDNTPSSIGGGFEIPGMPGASMGILNIKEVLGQAMGAENKKLRKLSVKDALVALAAEEAGKMIDEEKLIQNAIKTVENDGIVFLDEIDKIASRNEGRGGEASREGVQRDLLPLIEGTTVSTRYGTLTTDHILFIASGAFHLAKPSDLLPELQGRLPIRVELKPLTVDDMVRILSEPENSLIKQYKALIATEGVKLIFKEDAILRIAQYVGEFNEEVENIGARRLHTVLEKLLEEISFEASEMKKKDIIIDAIFVEKQLAALSKNSDLAKFIL